MASGLIALAGVLIGTAGTLAATWIASRASSRDAREARLEARESQVRELAADAYASAVEAVQWLSTMHVEDSVDPQFAEEYVPKTERAVERLRHATDQMSRVAALGGGDEFTRIATETLIALQMLDHSWHEGQEYRRKKVQGLKPGKYAEFVQRHLDTTFDDLQTSRAQLCGFDGSDLPRKELPQGSVLPGSLLFELRALTSGSRLR